MNERWRRVRGVLRKWYARPLEQRDAGSPDELAALEAELGRQLPLALREWWQLAGGRWSVCELDGMPQGLTVYTSEDQFDRAWIRFADFELEDPPVFGWDADDEEVQVGRSYSEYVLVQCLTRVFGLDPEAPDFGQVGDWVRVGFSSSAKACKRLEALLTPLPLEASQRLYGDADTIAYLFDTGFHVATRTEAAWARADACVNAAGARWKPHPH